MRSIKMKTAPIKAEVLIPGSKSITNRALLLAALAEGVSEISGILISDDTMTFVNALRELGVGVALDKDAGICVVTGVDGRFPNHESTIWCADSAMAARFLAAACASSPGHYQFDGSEQLRNRPIAELLRILVLQGVKIQPEQAATIPFEMDGTEGLEGGHIEVEASESGQFVSALLMIAPFAQQSMVLKIHDLVSRPYIDMTCKMMGEFGVVAQRMHQARYSVPVPQRYRACQYVVEPDFSTASYFFAAAAVTAGEVTIQSVDFEASKQADVQFLAVLQKMGCQVILNKHGLTVVGPKELRGVNVDMRDYPDAFMTLAAIAPFANSPTTITNIAHARKKESDRIQVMYTELCKLGVKVEQGDDWLRVYPSTPKGALIESHHDHRIAMAFAVLGLRVDGVRINQSECVSKTCPAFFELWERL